MTTFSFGGCGWLLSYGLGFAKSAQLRLKGVPWFERCHFAGSSGGALVAAVLATGVPAEHVQQHVWDAAKRLEKLPFSVFRTRVGLELTTGMELMFPSDAHKLVSDRLHVSLTKMDKGVWPSNRLISQFDTREALMDTLRTSCHIPGYTHTDAKLRWYDGEWHLDGGFTNNAPIITPHTYRVSPFTFPDTYDVTPYRPHPCYSSCPTCSPWLSPSRSHAPFSAFDPSSPSSPSLSSSTSSAEEQRSDEGPFDYSVLQLLRYALWPEARVLGEVYDKGVADGDSFIKLLLTHQQCPTCSRVISEKALPNDLNLVPFLVPANLIKPWVWS